MRTPSQYVLDKILRLRIDTVRGRIYREDVEIATNKGQRKFIGMRDENSRSITMKRYHVIWFKKTGRWPKMELHHKDEDTTNDRFSNLEEVTHARNCLLSKRSNLPIGVDRHGDRYRVRKCRDGKVFFVGKFKTLEEAVGAL